MHGYCENIEKLTLGNPNFRQVIYTGANLQLVLMSLKPGESIGLETHPDIDQFFRFEHGEGECVVGTHRYHVTADDAVIVPAGAAHDVINVGQQTLKFYTLYGPPEHVDGTTHPTRDDATEQHFDGVTTE